MRRLIVSILVALLYSALIQGYSAGVAVAGHALSAESKTIDAEDGERELHVRLRLRVPFQLMRHSKLVIATKGSHIGFPIEAFEGLYLVSKTGYNEIDDPNKLEGRVRIRTPKEALAYCRLRTSPRTYTLWDDDPEVVSREDVNMAFCFGDRECLDQFSTITRSGYLGVVKNRLMLACLGIKTAKAEKTAKGFRVSRTLLTTQDSLNYYMVNVVETVTPTGGYDRHVTKRWKARNGKGIDWGIPILM